MHRSVLFFFIDDKFRPNIINAVCGSIWLPLVDSLM